MDCSALARLSNCRLAYVTPSHQYPSGVTLSLARRLELLAWAERTQGWIVEDDYDGEYRYSGAPLAPLAALDRNGRVIYVGTFGKVVRFQFVARDVLQSCFMSFNHAGHNDIRRNITDTHQEKLYQRDVYSRYFGGQPQEERYIMEEKYQENNASYNEEGG
jgi:hypothetical protein